MPMQRVMDRSHNGYESDIGLEQRAESRTMHYVIIRKGVLVSVLTVTAV